MAQVHKVQGVAKGVTAYVDTVDIKANVANADVAAFKDSKGFRDSKGSKERKDSKGRKDFKGMLVTKDFKAM